MLRVAVKQTGQKYQKIIKTIWVRGFSMCAHMAPVSAYVRDSSREYSTSKGNVLIKSQQMKVIILL